MGFLFASLGLFAYVRSYMCPVTTMTTLAVCIINQTETIPKLNRFEAVTPPGPLLLASIFIWKCGSNNGFIFSSLSLGLAPAHSNPCCTFDMFASHDLCSHGTSPAPAIALVPVQLQVRVRVQVTATATATCEKLSDISEFVGSHRLQLRL